MRAFLLVFVLTIGCARGPLSYDGTVRPFEHRAIHGLGGTACAGIGFGTTTDTVAIGLGCTVGLVAVEKAVLAIRHPERIGPHTLPDMLCDTIWSAAWLPLLVTKRHGWRGGLLTVAAWVGSAMLVAPRCVP